MVQGIFGGATSYEMQSLQHILEDVILWIKYSNDMMLVVSNNASVLKNNRFWWKVGYDFKATISDTRTCLESFLHDLNLIKDSIENDRITQREVHLLRKIGENAVRYNIQYGQTYKSERWHDYGNPDFKAAEEIYCKGRDYFVTLQDASNAAARLEDYVKSDQATRNSISIQGDVYSSQIQQGTENSEQSIEEHHSFDYDKVLEILAKIKDATQYENFNKDFGEKSIEVKQKVDETIEMVKNKEHPNRIKKCLNILKEMASKVTTSVLAKGICEFIKGLPI